MNKTTSSLTEQDFVRLPADRSLADAIVRPSVSYWRDVLRRIRSDKVAIVSLTFLVIIILMAVFAPRKAASLFFQSARLKVCTKSISREEIVTVIRE